MLKQFSIQHIIMAVLTSGWATALVDQIEKAEPDYTAIIVTFTGVLTALVGLISVLSSTRNDAFKNAQSLVITLQSMVNEQKREIERLDRELNIERRRWVWSQDYIRILVHTLKENKIEIPELPKVDIDGGVIENNTSSVGGVDHG